jgi:hypothetical protein
VLTTIPSELVDFLESGISILVGTRDAHLQPEFARAVGVRIEPGRDELLVWVPASTSVRTIANLRDNGRLAVCFSAVDHRTFQFKGTLAELREARADERPLLERYRAAVAQHWGFVGLPPRLTHRMIVWPAYALRLSIESMYQQTPGPGAGAPLGAPRRGKKK